MHITKDQLEELEFPELLAEISPFAYSPKTAQKIAGLRPFQIDEAEISLKKVSEFVSSFESDNAIPFDEYEDIEEELKMMVIENFRLDNVSFIKIKSITDQVGRLQRFLPVYGHLFLHLNNDIKDLEYKKEIIDKIDKVFNRFGEVKSEASPILKTLRTEISYARKTIQENFNRSLTALSSTDFLDDIRESIMDDQRVLAVKSGYKKRVPGRVLGVSKTGSITYIHPKKEFKVKLKDRDKHLFFDEVESDLNKLDKIIDDLEPEMRLPVLIKKYIKQNAKVVSFNVDPGFNDAIDGLMYIRISDLPESTIKPVLEEMSEQIGNEENNGAENQ